MSLFIKASTNFPKNISTDNQEDLFSYETIKLYNNKVEITGISAGDDRLIFGLSSNAITSKVFEQLVLKNKIENQEFIKQIFNSSETRYSGDLFFKTVNQFSKRSIISFDLESKQSVYLIAIHGTQDNFSFYMYEIIKGGNATSNAVIDLRSRTTKPSFVSKEKIKSFKQQKLTLNRFFNGHLSTNEKKHVEIFYSIDLFGLLKEVVTYPDLVELANYKEFLASFAVIRNTVNNYGEIVSPGESNAIKLAPLKLSSSNSILYYQGVDESTIINQMYDYTVQANVVDKSVEYAKRVLTSFEELTETVSSISNSRQYVSFLLKASTLAPKVLSILGNRNPDANRIIRALTFNTDVDSELLSRIESDMRDLTSLMHRKLNVTKNKSIYKESFKSSQYSFNLPIKYRLNKNIAPSLAIQRERGKISKVEALTLISEDESTLSIAKTFSLLFNKERSFVEPSSLQTSYAQIGVDNEKIGRRILNGICTDVEAVKEKADLYVYKPESKSDELKFSYLDSHWSTAGTERWLPLTQEQIQSIIDDGSSYLVRIENSDRVMNKYFVLV